MFHVKRRYLCGLDKNLTCLSDLLFDYFLKFPEELQSLQSTFKGSEKNLQILSIYEKNVKDVRELRHRILNWRTNIERELLLGDMIGKFNNLIEIPDCVVSVPTSKLDLDSEEEHVYEAIKLKFGNSIDAKYWRVNSIFTDDTRMIGTLYKDEECTEIHQVLYSLNREVGIPLQPFSDCLFDKTENCYVLYFKSHHEVNYLCPNIGLSKDYIALFESLIDQRTNTSSDSIVYPTSVLTHPLSAKNKQMMKLQEKMKELDRSSYFSLVNGTLIQFLHGESLKYLIIDEKVTHFTTLRYSIDSEKDLNIEQGEQLVVYYKSSTNSLFASRSVSSEDSHHFTEYSDQGNQFRRIFFDEDFSKTDFLALNLPVLNKNTSIEKIQLGLDKSLWVLDSDKKLFEANGKIFIHKLIESILSKNFPGEDPTQFTV